jgi:hypothetical protein
MQFFLSRLKVGLVAVASLIAFAAVPASAQVATGTVSGHVADSGGLAVPGVTVTAESTSLQGVRTVTTTTQGDYIFSLLPPGQYTITFTLNGFGTIKEARSVGASQSVEINATLKPANVTEQVQVEAGNSDFANAITNGTNVKERLLQDLPTTRTLLSAVALAPNVAATGPSGSFVIGGAMSFENVFLLNGVQIQDNIRGTPFNLFIEDAIDQTTVLTSGVSAEYGRFTGGLVNAITKSGGNTFSGSLRETFTNDNWRAVSPFGEPKLDKTVPTTEYTFGGPIFKNRTWFFTAGRMFDSKTAATTGVTAIPFTSEIDEKRFEGKVTQSFGKNQSLQVGYTTIPRTERGDTSPNPDGVFDLNSLVTRKVPQNLLSAHYTDIISNKFVVEGQFSQRHFSFQGAGAKSTDLITGTALRDQDTGNFYWSPEFCGVCGDETRDNREYLVKGNYFLSTSSGAHNLVFGYDGYDDIRNGDNHQSGSDWHLWSIVDIQGQDVHPEFLPDGSTYIINWPILQANKGSSFFTHSFFANDSWQVNNRLSFNLGLRFDKNHGVDGAGNVDANDSATSPRLGVSWDPAGNGRNTINASYGRYVDQIASSITDLASPAGSPAIIAWFYGGAPINATGAPYVPTAQAIQMVFDWFYAHGGTSRSPFFTSVPGLDRKVNGTLASPRADEFTVGIGHQVGSRGTLRADFVNRNFSHFYSETVNGSTGIVTDEFGNQYDLRLISNSDALTRKYRALSLQARYRLNTRTDVGAVYTLSRTWGNVENETVGSGPVTDTTGTYPEYVQESWNNPIGDLSTDQRHRLRLWGTWAFPLSPAFGTLGLGVLEQINSGSPYGAIGSVDSSPYVTNAPAYITPPSQNGVTYYFTPRDAFHTAAMVRTDLSVNYSHKLGARASELFAQLQLLNAFNQFQIFNIAAINTVVKTNFNDATLATFNPFTQSPVEGVNWAKGSSFGKPISGNAYTLPRTFQFAIGVRF